MSAKITIIVSNYYVIFFIFHMIFILSPMSSYQSTIERWLIIHLISQVPCCYLLSYVSAASLQYMQLNIFSYVLVIFHNNHTFILKRPHILDEYIMFLHWQKWIKAFYTWLVCWHGLKLVALLKEFFKF